MYIAKSYSHSFGAIERGEAWTTQEIRTFFQKIEGKTNWWRGFWTNSETARNPEYVARDEYVARVISAKKLIQHKLKNETGKQVSLRDLTNIAVAARQTLWYTE